MSVPHDWRWGTPDWRHAAQYPIPSTTSLRQWRWEFTRRRSDYRENWLLHFASCYQRDVTTYANIRCPEGVVSWGDHFSHVANCPNIDFGYGTGGTLIDPAERLCPIPIFFRRVGGVLEMNDLKYYRPKEVDEIVLYKFDLRVPLAEQIKSAEQHLKLLQEEKGIVVETKRRQVSKWPRYLRIIDARDAGVPYEEIGESLISLDPDCPPDEYDGLASIEPKVWAKKSHDAALRVAFNFPA